MIDIWHSTRMQRDPSELARRYENALRCRCKNMGAQYYTPAQREAMKQ